MKGLQKSMVSVFGNGLEIFVPKVKLKPGSEMKAADLVPETVEERPLLTAEPWLSFI